MSVRAVGLRYMKVVLEDRSDWRADAECAGAQPELFDVFGTTLTRANLAGLVYCARCPVADRCAAEADAFADTGVIRGGVPRYDSTGAARIKQSQVRKAAA